MEKIRKTRPVRKHAVSPRARRLSWANALRKPAHFRPAVRRLWLRAASVRIAAAVLLLSVVAAAAPLYAAGGGTGIAGLFRRTLPNGMEIFVMENHAAPLAYVEIAVRSGAVSQTRETAGLFHLYEHLMFKGNEKFRDQQAFTDELDRLGAGDWNGATGVDRVNYHITVPSSAVRDGIEFWAYAVRTPLLDEGELEREKGVVLSEITGDHTDPQHIRSGGIRRSAFPDEPWRLDPSGDPEAVRNATVAQLRKIQREFYIPANAALFVGGDVSHGEIFEIAEKAFGGWENGDARPKAARTFPRRPAGEPKRLVFADPSSSDAFVGATYILRGPDGETDAADTFPADVWSSLIEVPGGEFERAFTENPRLAVPDGDYVTGGYYTMRTSGQISVGALMRNEPNMTSVARAEEFQRTVRGRLTEAMLGGAFTEGIALVERRLEDARIYQQETAEGVLSNLSFFFAAVGADYYLGYSDGISRVTADDVRSFVRKYIEGQAGILVVTVSEAEFERRRDEFLSAGYEQITADNAFWWKEGK